MIKHNIRTRNRSLSLLWLLALCLSLPAQDSISDFDGNYYQTVVIGDQTWMARNLKCEHDASGKKIHRICYGHYQPNCDFYGGLYSWDVMMCGNNEEQFRGICPEGWHLPCIAEWDTLIKNLGGADSAAFKLKTHHIDGFPLQYGGNFHNRLKNFNFQDNYAYYWTSTPYSSTAAWIWTFGRRNLNANRSTVPKVYCLSVRCVKDF